MHGEVEMDARYNHVSPAVTSNNFPEIPAHQISRRKKLPPQARPHLPPLSAIMMSYAAQHAAVESAVAAATSACEAIFDTAELFEMVLFQ